MAQALAAGTPAPAFNLPVTADQRVSLQDLAGRPVILAFYPADCSPVCGDQMALYNEILPEFGRAGAQGKFWQAHDMLYENQQALSQADLLRYGQALGLNLLALDAAFAGAHDTKIETDFRVGVRSGVNGTPTLFINGQRYDGPRDAGSLIHVLKQLAPA